MKVFLKVPFAEKDEAKKLGGRWDPTKKLWFVENVENLSPFSRWLSEDVQKFDDGVPAAKPISPVKATSTSHLSEGILQVGSKYRATPVVCTCLAWETCDRCASDSIKFRL